MTFEERRDFILNNRATMSLPEIAKAIGCRLGSVKRVVYRAHKKGDPRAEPIPKSVIDARRNAAVRAVTQTQEYRDKMRAVLNGMWRVEEFRKVRGRSISEGWRKRQEREAAQQIEIPAWVERAGMDLEYLAIAETRGEEAAAAHCRRLKASAPCPAGALRRVGAAAVVGGSGLSLATCSDDVAPSRSPPGAANLTPTAQPAQRVLSRGAP